MSCEQAFDEMSTTGLIRTFTHLLFLQGFVCLGGSGKFGHKRIKVESDISPGCGLAFLFSPGLLMPSSPGSGIVS